MEQILQKSADKICDSLCDIVKGFEKHVENGLTEYNTDEAGKVADIIKDLSEAYKNINEGCYYTTVKAAMERGIDLDFKPMVDQKKYNNAYLNKGSMMSGAQMRMAEPSEMNYGYRMAYEEPMPWDPNWPRPRMGYEAPDDPRWDDRGRGEPKPTRPDIHVADPNR